jgi:hypothetical protein
MWAWRGGTRLSGRRGRRSGRAAYGRGPGLVGPKSGSSRAAIWAVDLRPAALAEHAEGERKELTLLLRHVVLAAMNSRPRQSDTPHGTSTDYVDFLAAMAVYRRVARPLWACSMLAIEWQFRVEPPRSGARPGRPGIGAQPSLPPRFPRCRPSFRIRVRVLPHPCPSESTASSVKGGSERCRPLRAAWDALDRDGAEPRHQRRENLNRVGTSFLTGPDPASVRGQPSRLLVYRDKDQALRS